MITTDGRSECKSCDACRLELGEGKKINFFFFRVSDFVSLSFFFILFYLKNNLIIN